MSSTRLQKVAAIMAVATIVFCVLTPVSVAIPWVFFEDFGINKLNSVGILAASDLNYLQRFTGFIISMLSASFAMYGYYHLFLMFRECRSGEYFSQNSINGFRVYAWTVLIVAGMRVVESPMLSLAVTATNEPGKRQLVFSLSSEHIQSIFMALLLVIIAHVLAEARKMYSENEAFL